MKYLIIACFMLFITPTHAEDDQQALTDLVIEFLSKVDDKDMHERFWADDLIYTSSAGSRFGKNVIMSGFGSDSDKSTYSAENLSVNLLGDAAVVTLTLVRLTAQGETLNYLNTTVFAKRKGAWVAVNHQSTKVPE